jgi:hypothetical protein
MRSGMRPIHPGEILREDCMAPAFDTTTESWLNGHLELLVEVCVTFASFQSSGPGLPETIIGAQ